jgi:tRNA 5-methylaminomethyl-2-thiouridine biosynthesis bifunctional protein
MAESPPNPHLSPLECAAIEWQDGDVPAAKNYGDIYFSPLDGLQETEYVFLQHNHLAERWQLLEADNQHIFSIGEIGFGTGLNFLTTWQLWQEVAPNNTQLHFISAEKHPLRLDDLKRSLKKWPQLKPLAEQLIDAYPVLIPGHHLIKFCQGQVNLHLLLGDATVCFEQFRASSHPELAAISGHTLDAWFLDGFAPAKNPELWSDSLFELIAQLSKPGTTVATFSAAGFVRRALQSLGFEMKKVPGFKHKREMLRGTFIAHPKHTTASPTPLRQRNQAKAPWYVLPKHDASIRQATIIGAGLAGVSSAYALAQRGWQVTLIDRRADVAQEASGNPQGMLYTKLSATPGKLNDFALASYLYAVRFYQQLVTQKQLNKADYDLCGLLQLVTQDQERKNFEALKTQLAAQSSLVKFVDAQQASHISGVHIEQPAYYFPNAGWLSPAQLCRQLIKHQAITPLFHSEVLDLAYEQSHPSQKGQWQLLDQHQQTVARAEVVIIANSLDATRFSCSNHLPIKPIRGQISQIPSEGPLAQLKTVICHDGYITPAIGGLNSIGATFTIGDRDCAEKTVDHQRNIDNLYKAIPSLMPQGVHHLDASTITGRAGIRCTTPDYLPMVGQLPDYPQFLQDYQRLRKDANWPISTPGCYHPGLYLNIGHGSRGLTSTPLCSELLAAIINNEPSVLPRHLVKALHPARFVIRDLIRNKI